MEIRRQAQAKRCYGAIAAFTVVAVAINLLGINPMKALLVAGIVQGFSTPPLMLLIMLLNSQSRDYGGACRSAGH